MSEPIPIYVTKDAFEGRNQVNDERFSRDAAQLKENREDLKMVEKLTVQMGEMIKRHDDKLEDQGTKLTGIEGRVAAIEQKPMATLDKIKNAVIGSLVTLILGGVAGVVAYIVNSVK